MSDMKCPFCGQELREIYFNGVGVGYICPNPDCKKAEKLKGNTEFWQEMIRTKKALYSALDVAIDALKYANKCIKGGCVNWETEIDRALAKITALEQKESSCQ